MSAVKWKIKNFKMPIIPILRKRQYKNILNLRKHLQNERIDINIFLRYKSRYL